MSTDELSAALTAAQSGTPETSVEDAITIYLAAAAEIDKYRTVQDQAKQLITDVMVETGETKYRTRAGSVTVTAPGRSVTYSAAALDALCASSDEARRLLEPHRKVTERAGTLRITAAK